MGTECFENNENSEVFSGAIPKSSVADLFDTEFYLLHNPDVKSTGIDALEHYIMYGWKEGRNPSEKLSTNGYLKRHPELVEAQLCPLIHYIQNGQVDPEAWQELQGKPAECYTKEEIGLIAELFDANYYIKHYSVPPETLLTALEYYIHHGWKEGHNPNDWFSTSGYLNRYPDVKNALICPLLHYCIYGKAEGRATHDLNLEEESEIASPGFEVVSAIGESFDSAYYKSTYPDIRDASIDPLIHYLVYGWKEGRNPNSWFSNDGYLNRYPDVKSSSINPLVHYIMYGQAEGRDFSSFDTISTEEGIYAKYKEQMIKDKIFDEAFYYVSNPDVAAAQLDAFTHFMHHGWLEDRDPSPYFSLSYYKRTTPGLSEDQNPALDYAVKIRSSASMKVHQNFIHTVPLTTSPHRRIAPYKIPVSRKETVKLARNSKICVHIHCYYIDVLQDLISAVKGIKHIETIFVTYSDKSQKETIESIIKSSGCRATQIITHLVPNKGRDIAPLIILVGRLLSNYDTVLHIHTKKSVERGGFGTLWLEDLLRKLLFNESYVERVLDLFDSEDSLGLVGPWPHDEIYPFMHWGNNKNHAIKLFEVLGISSDFTARELDIFPASSMFWFRPKALAKIFSSSIDWHDFQSEPISDDGTLAHAIERSFAEVARLAGYQSIYIEPLNYEFTWPHSLKKRVSIIIPVYNSVEWLNTCINSILSQETAATPLEIILVDNNSSDGSHELMLRLERLHNNIRVFKEKKQGAGAARNTGLRHASAEHVMFVDADDVIASNAVQVLYDIISTGNVDFAASNLIMFSEQHYSDPMPYRFQRQLEFVEKENYSDNKAIFKAMFADFGPCAKMYKKSFLASNDIYFEETGSFEDNPFIVRVYCKAQKIAVSSVVTYLYRKYEQREGVTQSTNLSRQMLKDQRLSLKNAIVENDLLVANSINRDLLEAIVNKMRVEMERIEGACTVSDIELLEYIISDI